MIPISDNIPSRHFPVINWTLIALNIIIFFFTLSLGKDAEIFVKLFGVVPYRFINDFDIYEISTIYTSMFLHGGWAHIFSNMLALYIFGDNVEDRLGSFRYLIFYLLTGTAAALLHIYLNQDSVIPTVGASGAISGVMAAYIFLYPRAKVITLFPILFIPFFIDIPALVYTGVWFITQFFSGLLSIVSNTAAFGGVAYWAHVGGFVAGAVLLPFMLRNRKKRRTYIDEFYPW
ncbi:rhomboid family protein [Melioribacter roseus P3M-2]|jgi:membrane associated rhomboid family serine protease|uniref:Rhomboid family protein n=1 Tax=Melioribacter roseus (strain DSM 23840 / JCM 17771 / VKM B-2668 / P3M-2) TaxID=1191523 RepID=I7A165_MELRP|nr:rhomboid family intramembrane serine protease [Melioribacter roseus]AFN73721.1 rhomboid family protein [Melioribacter roseus P3M-2]